MIYPFFYCNKKKGIPCGITGDAMDIEIPTALAEDLLLYAAETELPVEVIVEAAIRSILERKNDNG